ncbi:MAG: VWA-like domain-containing protein [Lachnotalea sp.]
METNFENQVNELRFKSAKLLRVYANSKIDITKLEIAMPEDFKKEFYRIIDKVNLSLMEDRDNFYGYFLFHMERDIRFDINSPSAVNFKNTKYVIYFNPFIFLNLNLKQMESTIKHEILHILSLHLLRAKKMKNQYSKVIINMAMDIVVNQYLDHLPPYETTIKEVNSKYALNLEANSSFEYYADKLQTIQDQLDKKKKLQDNKGEDERIIETEYDVEKTHDIWEESSDMDEKIIQEFNLKVIRDSRKGEIPAYLGDLIASIENSKGELPWQLYLDRLMGSVEGNKIKTTSRRDRRQPNRLDLRGQLRSHKAKIIVAIDISGSINNKELKQAMIEVLDIIKNNGHEITVVECNDSIRRIYKVKSKKDFKDRIATNGSTKFTPVFEYANHNKVNLLIYFTDGKGEDRLSVIPRGYKVLWVLSGKEEELSLAIPYGTVKKLKNIEIKENILDIRDVDRGGFSMNNIENVIESN